MVELGGRADWPEWWDERSYAYAVQLTRREWAWEFLRRNPAFQRDLVRAREQVEHLESSDSLDVIVLPVDLSRWGVLFR